MATSGKTSLKPPKRDPRDRAGYDRRLRAWLIGLLEEYGGNLSHIAQATGRHRQQFQFWLRRLGIDANKYWRAPPPKVVELRGRLVSLKIDDDTVRAAVETNDGVMRPHAPRNKGFEEKLGKLFGQKVLVTSEYQPGGNYLVQRVGRG
jgi:transposase-like protein